jgi:hypothetical protein
MNLRGVLMKISMSWKKASLLIASLGLMTVAGCGRSSDISAIPAPQMYQYGATPCVAPAIQFKTRPGGYCMSGSFDQVCAANYGSPQTLNGSGIRVCKFSNHEYFDTNPVSSSGNLIQLSQSNPAAQNVLWTSTPVFANARVRYDGSSGSQYYCNGQAWDFDGTLPGSSVQTWAADTKRAGLTVSDGTQTYFVGDGLSVVVLGGSGRLRVGINYDSCATSKYDFSIGAKLVIEQCEDANGNTYLCN